MPEQHVLGLALALACFVVALASGFRALRDRRIGMATPFVTALGTVLALVIYGGITDTIGNPGAVALLAALAVPVGVWRGKRAMVFWREGRLLARRSTPFVLLFWLLVFVAQLFAIFGGKGAVQNTLVVAALALGLVVGGQIRVLAKVLKARRAYAAQPQAT